MDSTDKGIIVIIDDFGHVNGGHAKVAISSAGGLVRRGYKVIYFCAVEPIDQELRQAAWKSCARGGTRFDRS